MSLNHKVDLFHAQRHAPPSVQHLIRLKVDKGKCFNPYALVCGLTCIVDRLRSACCVSVVCQNWPVNLQSQI